MQLRDVYITDLAIYLPNDPVDNDSIESVLGMVAGKPSRSRKIVLRNNGIKRRFYAIDPKTLKLTHTNAQLAAEAVRKLIDKAGIDAADIECLACGTSSSDQVVPGHASMVHGELANPPCEIVSTSGICSAGVTSLKYAAMDVMTGQARKTVATGSELASKHLRGTSLESEIEARIEALEKRPEIAFEKDFLRWMLSDGAGAALLSDTPNADRLSLKIEWIDGYSYANELPACMYSGAIKLEDGSLEGWCVPENQRDIVDKGYMPLKQDARLLDEHIMPISGRALAGLVKRHNLNLDDVTWYLPHYSSEYFRSRLHDQMEAHGVGIEYDRWFTNLPQIGNIGSASIYAIMEELMYSGKLNKGDTLLCYIPESGRFSIYYMLLTVV